MDALARKYIQRGGRDVLLFFFFFSLSPFSSYREGKLFAEETPGGINFMIATLSRIPPRVEKCL